MGYLLLKAALSGAIIALASEVARRHAGFGALIASLPLVSLLTVVWLWRDTGDVQRIADHMSGTLLFVLPSLPMFALVPWLLRQGWGLWTALGLGCALTVALYGLAVLALPRS